MAYGDDAFARMMEARRLYGNMGGLGGLSQGIENAGNILAQGFQEAQKQPLATAQLEAELYGKQYQMEAAKKQAAVDQARWEAEQKLREKQLAQAKELKLLDIANERMKLGAAKQDQDKVTVRAMQEVGSRAKDLKTNLDKLETLIDKYGTEELLGSQSEEMDQLLMLIAIDNAKIVDPQSVAREGEVAAAQKYLLPVKSWFKSEGTAKKLISNLRGNIDSMVASRQQATGLDTTGKFVGHNQVDLASQPQASSQQAPQRQVVFAGNGIRIEKDASGKMYQIEDKNAVAGK